MGNIEKADGSIVDAAVLHPTLEGNWLLEQHQRELLLESARWSCFGVQYKKRFDLCNRRSATKPNLESVPWDISVSGKKHFRLS